MNKDRLLKYIQIAYANVEQAVAELNSSQVNEPIVEGDWSAKDLIAHLAYWMQREADNLKTHRGKTIERYYDSRMSVDAVNRLVYGQNRERTIEEVMQDYRQAYRELVEEFEHLTDADLMDSQTFTWTGGETLAASIASETYEHLNEHLAALRQYIKSVQGQAWPHA